MRKGVRYEFHKSEFLYNGNAIAKPVDDLVVVEGFASVWWLWQHGYKNVVALMGSSVSERQAALLYELLSLNGRLWIFADGDPAGEFCAHDLFLKVSPYCSVRWAKLDEGQPTELSSEELGALLF